MSGVFGTIHFDGRPVEANAIASMRAALRVRAVDGERLWIEGPAAIGHLHSRVTPESIVEEQPLVHESLIVSFDGRLDNRASGSSVSDSSVVLSSYQRHGDDCIARLVGDFAFALFDARKQRLLLARDIMAARPLYYVSLPNGIAFASEIKSLLAHPAVVARPDEDGLADLLLNGYCDGHTTWFENVRSVPPGSVVAVTADRITVNRVSQFKDAEIRYASLDDYADQFRMLFTQAVARRLRSAHPVAVAISGGLDSSAIQCEATRIAGTARVRGVNLSYPRGTTADEHEFIDALRDRGLQIDEVPVDHIRWLVSADRSITRTEMPSLVWEQEDAMFARARQAGCRLLLTGFFADQVLTGEAYLVDLMRRGQWASVRRHLRETVSWMTDVDPRVVHRRFFRAALRMMTPAAIQHAYRLMVSRSRKRWTFAPWFTTRFRERAIQRALDRSPQRRRFGSAHAEECWRRATSGYYVAALAQTGNVGVAHQLDVSFPFRDRDLVAFLMAIPGDVVCANGVPKGLLRRSLEGVLPDAIRLRRSKGDGTAFNNGAALAEEQTIRTLLSPRSMSAQAGYLDADALHARIPTIFGSGLKNNDSALLAWQIGDTLALELWLQRFCSGTSCN